MKEEEDVRGERGIVAGGCGRCWERLRLGNDWRATVGMCSWVPVGVVPSPGVGDAGAVRGRGCASERGCDLGWSWR